MAREVLFSLGFAQPITKLMLRLRQPKFHSVAKWRSRNSSQINFSVQFELSHHVYRTVKVKGRKLEREGGIFMS